MIVFNVFAIPILIVVGAVGAALVWLAPGIFGGPYEEITYSVLAIAVGGFAEVVGLRGRLFFLPIWLLGGVVLAWQLWALFGMLGLVAGGGLVGLLGVAFVGTIAWAVASAEREAPKALEAARGLLAEGKLILAKAKLADAWKLPTFGSVTPERARHLSAVLGEIERHAAPLAIRGDGPALLRGARILVDRSIAGNVSYGFFSEESQLLGEVEWMLVDAAKWSLKPHLRAVLGTLG